MESSLHSQVWHVPTWQRELKELLDKIHSANEQVMRKMNCIRLIFTLSLKCFLININEHEGTTEQQTQPSASAWHQHLQCNWSSEWIITPLKSMFLAPSDTWNATSWSNLFRRREIHDTEALMSFKIKYRLFGSSGVRRRCLMGESLVRLYSATTTSLSTSNCPICFRSYETNRDGVVTWKISGSVCSWYTRIVVKPAPSLVF